ncbi:MAG: TolC family protein [Thermoguttaceae bacterium]|nr:TolC family protein [Thermoguttaceae bacterium]
MKPYFQRGAALSALLALVVGGGCKVGSDYRRPNASAQLNETYTQVESEGVQQQVGADVSSWWSQINDPVLSQLTQEALSGNLTLREAMFRIQSARAALGSTNANLLPQFAQDGGYAFQSFGGNTQNVFSTATSMSWEIDVFGRLQRSIEAATADMEVQRELYRDAYVILVGDVAQTYVDARSYQEQIRVAKWNIKIQELTEKFVKDNVDAGSMSHLDLSRARGPLNVTDASLDALQTQYQQALNRLSILVGQAPGHVDELMYLSNDDIDEMSAKELEGQLEALLREITDMESKVAGSGASEEEIRAEIESKRLEILTAWLEETLPTLTPKTPEEILVGIPADLLRRRPDVRAAEQRIIAQNARVGVAVADLYPMFSLSGSFGLEADTFSNMFDGDSIAAGVGPAFRWNILNFGKYRFNIEAQRFVQEELIATYRQTILEAAEDVDNALVMYVKENNRNHKLQRANADYLYALLLANFRRTSGADNIQPVLEAQAGLLTSQLQYVQCKTNQSGSVIRLYRALGGDWDAQGSAASVATTAQNPNAEWERQRAESAARLAERGERYAHVSLEEPEPAPQPEPIVENADFEIAEDVELEASPELAEPSFATTEEAYADEAILIAE